MQFIFCSLQYIKDIFGISSNHKLIVSSTVNISLKRNENICGGRVQYNIPFKYHKS